MLGKIGAGEYKDKYVCSYVHPEKGLYKYTDVTISEDYFEALSAFAQHIQDQADTYSGPIRPASRKNKATVTEF